MSNKEASSDDYQVMGTFKLPEKETSIAVELQTVEDMVVEGDETLIVFVALQVGTVLHTASPVTLTIRNDDEPTWVVTAAPSAIEEGGAGAATLTVDTGGVTFPDNQTIGLELGGETTVGTDHTISDSEAMALTAPYSLTLPAEAMTVTATIAASSDTVADPGETIVITATHDSDQIGQPQAITITDGGTAGVTIDYSTKPMTLTVPEGGSNTYTVVLDTQPSDVVTVTVNGHTGSDLMISPASLTFDTVSGHEGTDLSVNPSSLTFTRITWHTPQTVTVRAKVDPDAAKDETVILTHLVRRVDTDYAGIESELVSITIIENDTAGVTIDYSTKPMSLTVPEGGSNTYTVVLDTQPSAPVTVSGHVSTDLSVSDASLTFDTVTWSTPQTVTVSAQQDPDAVNERVTLTHSVSGTGEYATVTAADVKVTIEDNDTPGITEAGFAPKGLYHSINYPFRRGRFVLDYEALIWQQPDETPQAWNNADYKYRRNHGFDRYEVQWRSRSTSGGWSAWQEIELSNNPPTHAAERLQSYGDLPNTLRLTEWESRVRLDIEGPGPCEDKE